MGLHSTAVGDHAGIAGDARFLKATSLMMRFRSHTNAGGVSIPPSSGFRSLMMLGFDPAEIWGVDPYGCWVSIPPGPKCRSLVMRGFDPTESWGSIPDFHSKLTSKVLSKLTSKVLSKLTSKLLVRSLVSLLVNY